MLIEASCLECSWNVVGRFPDKLFLLFFLPVHGFRVPRNIRIYQVSQKGARKKLWNLKFKKEPNHTGFDPWKSRLESEKDLPAVWKCHAFSSAFFSAFCESAFVLFQVLSWLDQTIVFATFSPFLLASRLRKETFAGRCPGNLGLNLGLDFWGIGFVQRSGQLLVRVALIGVIWVGTWTCRPHLYCWWLCCLEIALISKTSLDHVPCLECCVIDPVIRLESPWFKSRLELFLEVLDSNPWKISC